MVRNYEMIFGENFLGSPGWREEHVLRYFCLVYRISYLILYFTCSSRTSLKLLAAMSIHASPCPSFPIVGLGLLQAKEWWNLGRLMNGLAPSMYPETMPASQIPVQFLIWQFHNRARHCGPIGISAILDNNWHRYGSHALFDNRG